MVVLFVMVLVSFALAHEDTKKMEQIYQGVSGATAEVLESRDLPNSDF